MNIKLFALLCGVMLAMTASNAYAADAARCCFVKAIQDDKIILTRSDDTKIEAAATVNPRYPNDARERSILA